MKQYFNLVPVRDALTVSLAVLLIAFMGSSAPAADQTPTQEPKPAAATPVKPPATPQAAAPDYLVQVRNHAMWKSQVEKMHPELARTAAPLSKKAGTDYLVQVGKTPVLASTLRRVTGPNATRPAPHDPACKDYLVASGKKTVWASEIGAPCPAGPHKGDQKPLCCVASISDEKKLPPCCKDAEGK